MSQDSTKRREKEAMRDQRVSELHARYPDLAAIDQSQRTTAMQLMRLIASQADPKAIQALEKDAQALSQARKAFLEQANIDPQIYEPDWDCSLCEDRGSINGQLCNCQKERHSSARIAASGLPEKLLSMRFDTIDLRAYSQPQDMAQKIARLQDFCRFIVAKEAMGNLILTGEVGRGKTHLAAAVANCVLDQGGRVRYWRVDSFLDELRRVKFEEEAFESERFFKDLREVDLLVLDDLGAESISEFSLNQLQRVIEERNLHNRSWIICTNLATNAIEENYDARLADRLFEKTSVFRLEGPRSYRGKEKPSDVRLI